MRLLAAIIALGLTSSAGHAHFVFLYVEGKDEARLVFGHEAKPDEKTPATRCENTKLVVRDSSGRETKLTIAKGEGNFYASKFQTGVMLYGTTEAGVTQRGEMPPMLSWYYPKTILGDPFAKTGVIGDAVPMEIVPIRDGEKIRFEVRAGGKAAEGIEFIVSVPGGGEEKAQTVKSDKEGRTPSFAEHGKYCVAARKTEEKPGAFGGKRYSAVRQMATLVVDFQK